MPDADRTPTSGLPAADLARAAARCFTGADGAQLMAHLRAITADVALGPGATDAHLRHLEGQRYLVRHLAAMIERGRQGTDTTTTHLNSNTQLESFDDHQ